MAQSKIVRTPTVLQMESVECGAASLSMMLGYYGRFVPLAQLRHECGVSRDGSKASNVLKAARLHNMKAKGFSKPIAQLKELECPFIVFWQFNHFLVVEGFDGDTVHLNDPAVGHRTVTWDEFDKAYTGVLLMMEPDEGFQKVGAPPSALPGIWQRIKSNLLPFLFVFISGVLLALPAIVIPTLIRVYLDSVVVEGRIGWFRPLIVAMGVALVLQASLKWLQLNYLRRLQVGLSARMAGQFFWHLLQLPVRFYSQRYPGEIVNRSYLNDKVAGIIAGPLATTMVELFTMLIYLSVLLSYSISLTLIGVVFAAANFVALQRLSKVRTEANMRLAKEEGMVQGQTIAGIQGIETLKGSGLEDGFFAKWCGYFANASNARQRLEFSTQSLGVLPIFLEALSMVLILVIGGFQVVEGHISIGFLVAFQSLMMSFLAPVSTLVNLGTVLQELHGDVLRLDDVLENPTVAKRASSAAPLPDQVQLSGRLELVDVTFGYSPLEPPLVEALSLKVEPGQRVALVGGSGSGKSTVSKLICGLVDAWSGDILFDGHRRDQLPDGVLSTSMAMVEQDIFLFEGTVRENLTIWDRTVSDQALLDACRDAEILDTISAIPGGFGGILAEGGRNLSGGQRQRLEIARALVATPSLLVLDEATSALDADTEARIDENLRRRGCTCVIVAHRLSTIRDCDEIIVLEKGKVVERGTHETLWQSGGYYSKLLHDTDDVTGGKGGESA